MVTPAAVREAAAHVLREHDVSERRACSIVGAHRSTIRYRSRRGDDGLLRTRLRQLATERRRFAEPVVHRLIEEIRRNQIDVVIVDPFVSTHAVSENDNPAIDRVAKTWARIAHETNCAIELVHRGGSANSDGRMSGFCA